VFKKYDLGNNQKRTKKDGCDSTIVLKFLFQNWFPLEGASSQEKKKQVK
jgi:hypothetical protein